MSRRRQRSAPRRDLVVCVPWVSRTNSYQSLLYEHLARHGITLVSPFRFDLRTLWTHPARRTVLHFHWPELVYADPKHPWRVLLRLGLRLAIARVLGYRIVWTVHQVVPHESRRLSDRAASVMLAGASHRLIVHDDHTARALRALPARASKIAHIPHPSYAGTYPLGRSRAERHRALRLSSARFVFLCFGRFRAYKDVPLLLTAFEQTRDQLPDVALVIAGVPADNKTRGRIQRAAEEDARIRTLLGFVPDTDIVELHGAADATIYPRADGGTSGTLLLSLSLGRPIVAARMPAYEELLGNETAGWLFTPGDATSLAEALTRAANPVEAANKGARALERLAGRDWDRAARRTAALMR